MANPKIEFLAYEDTPLGTLCLRRREPISMPGTLVTEVTLNHEFLMSSLYTDSERALAEGALSRCEGDVLRVLVGGLGLGYTAFETLKSDRVTELEVVELLPQVINWLSEGLVPLSEKLNADGRLRVSEDDVYQRLASDPTSELFDAILIDVDHSPDERLAGEHLETASTDPSSTFYTAAGLQKAKRHLNPGGVLAVWSYAESSPFVTALREVFADVQVEPVTYDNQLIDEQRTDWLFFGSNVS